MRPIGNNLTLLGVGEDNKENDMHGIAELLLKSPRPSPPYLYYRASLPAWKIVKRVNATGVKKKSICCPMTLLFDLISVLFGKSQISVLFGKPSIWNRGHK
jgi:hypothetical protein